MCCGRSTPPQTVSCFDRGLSRGTKAFACICVACVGVRACLPNVLMTSRENKLADVADGACGCKDEADAKSCSASMPTHTHARGRSKYSGGQSELRVCDQHEKGRSRMPAAGWAAASCCLRASFPRMRASQQPTARLAAWCAGVFHFERQAKQEYFWK